MTERVAPTNLNGKLDADGQASSQQNFKEHGARGPRWDSEHSEAPRSAPRLASKHGETDPEDVWSSVESFEDAVAYFDMQLEESNPEFWVRCGGRPELNDKRVLEVGCGHGALSVDMAQNGATVVGVDLNEWRVDFANELVRKRYPELVSRTHFTATATQDLPNEEPFDYILSKDTFEHVDDLDGLLESLYRLLKPGGYLIAGSTPLYYSPKGDHGRAGLRLPSLHAVLPRRLVFAAASRHQGYPVQSLDDIGLNGYSPEQYRQYFDCSRFEQVRIAYNQGKWMSRILDRFRGISGMEKYVTTGFYLKFRRPLDDYRC